MNSSTIDNPFLHHLDKLKKKLHNSRVQIFGIIDSVIDHITTFEQQAEGLTDSDFQSRIFSLFEEIKAIEPLKKICHSHRESFAFLGRFGKEIEAMFANNLEELHAHKAESFDSRVLDSVISDYLISQGMYDQANLLCSEGCMQTDKLLKFHRSIQLLENFELDAALLTIKELGEPARNIEFCIHKLKFIQILKSGNLPAAMEYARNYMQDFADTHLEEIKQLMCSCLFANRSENSPYSEMFADGYPKEIVKEMLREWSEVSGIPPVSPLQTILRTGDQVIAELIPLTQLAGDKFWASPVPTELKLDPELVFHSTFVCPVSKEVATLNNPPIMLPCGHLIAKHSMEKLLSSTIRAKFKCPTCPTEVTEKDTKKIII